MSLNLWKCLPSDRSHELRLIDTFFSVPVEVRLCFIRQASSWEVINKIMSLIKKVQNSNISESFWVFGHLSSISF